MRYELVFQGSARLDKECPINSLVRHLAGLVPAVGAFQPTGDLLWRHCTANFSATNRAKRQLSASLQGFGRRGLSHVA